MGGGTCLWVAEPGSAQSGTLGAAAGGAPGACAHRCEAAARSSRGGKGFIGKEISRGQEGAGGGVYNDVMLSEYLLITAVVPPPPFLMPQTPSGPARPPILGV